MLTNLRDRVLALLPAGTLPQRETPILSALTLDFDPQCAGHIERCWPDIFKLCAECGCTAVLISTDLMKVVSVLDTPSGAPNYSSENRTEVKLVLSQAGEMEVAA